MVIQVLVSTHREFIFVAAILYTWFSSGLTIWVFIGLNLLLIIKKAILTSGY